METNLKINNFLIFKMIFNLVTLTSNYFLFNNFVIVISLKRILIRSKCRQKDIIGDDIPSLDLVRK